MLHSAPREARHPRPALRRGDRRVAVLVEWHAQGVGEAERGRIEPLAAVDAGDGVRHWRSGGLVHHRLETVDLVGLAEVVHRGDSVVRQGEHAEVHLGSGLPVGHLELEEGDAEEEVVPGGQLEDHAEVLRLVGPDPVVLPDVHRRPREGGHVVVEELVLEVRGRVLRVEAVHPPRLVGRGDVVPGRVAVHLRVAHRLVQLRHLAQGRVAAELRAWRADGVGEGRGEVDHRPRHPCFLLRLEHRVEGADDGPAHLDRALGASDGGGRRHLQVRLVEDVHDP
mmetsp:Transcript_10140/g.31512  ORF Transcript_10140/g.31512 Transcript_10140/m.31512 type:complete len:281 (+) Transcript_10140:1327-2169(+)